MTRLALLLAFLMLGGCGSNTTTNQQSPPPPPPPSSPQPGRVETVLVRQPAAVPAYSNAPPPKDTLGATLWGAFEKLPSPPTDATSQNGILDIVIDSASIPRNVASRFGLGTIVLGYSFKVPVSYTEYRLSYDIRVPRADHGGGSVAQVVGYYNLHDKVNKVNLWLGQIVFDTRCDKAGDVKWDQGTNTPVVTTLAPNFSCRTFGDWRSVSFVAGSAQIAWAAQQLRSKYPALKLSSNPADFALTHINVNPETAAGTARIDVGLRNLLLVGVK
jgi:hypothetical protein